MSIYTKESLEKLKNKIDLAEVLQSHIDLKSSGASYKALCPFHEEKTPSFTVHRGDSHYHCFGCGAHGDAIHFLMTYQKMNFTEAVEHLAGKFQVYLEREEAKQEIKGPSKAKLKEALEAACLLFHFNLLHTEQGHLALKYLFNRGIALDMIQKFDIGLAPSSPEVLKALSIEKNYPQEILISAGLSLLGKDGRGRDFFNDRIMFPIRDAAGFVIGFSARKFKEETFGGKYINTSETPLFKKSKVLFGLNYSRRSIAKTRKAILVEGQIDALRLIHSGFDISVASQGTAFGEGHMQELIHLGVQQVTLAFDSDNAGQTAAFKVGHLFQKSGIEVFVLQLPENHDPDSYLRKKGVQAFQKLIEDSQDYLTFLYHYLAKNYKLDSPAGKNEFITEIVKQIRSWDHPLMVRESLLKVSKLSQVPEEMIGVRDEHIPNVYLKKYGNAGQAEVDPNRVLETDLLRWLLLMGATLPKLKTLAYSHLQPEDFQTPLCRRVYEIYKANDSLDLFTLALDLDEGELFMNEISQKKINREKAEDQFIETVERILLRNWMTKRESIKNKIQSGTLDDAAVMELVKEFDVLKQAQPKVNFS